MFTEGVKSEKSSVYIYLTSVFSHTVPLEQQQEHWALPVVDSVSHLFCVPVLLCSTIATSLIIHALNCLKL